MQSSDSAGTARERIVGLRPRVSTLSSLWRALRRNPSMLGGLIVILFFSFIAIAAPIITFHDAFRLDVVNRLQSPGAENWFGTDNLGRDSYALVAYGARVSLTVGASVALLSSIAGVFIGVTAGYFRKLDDIVMRFMDGVMAIPGILLAIALMALLGGSLFNVIVAITVTDSPRTARLVRSMVLSIREEVYIDAARAFGASNARILAHHVLPNTFTPIIVQATFLFATAILIEASLSFLGAGIPPTTPSWGNMIGEARTHAVTNPHVVIFPGIALFLVALAMNLFGDGLRDNLDPKLRGKT